VQEVLVDYNSVVKKGDVLARIDPASYDSKLKQAQAQLTNTRANFTLTKLNHDRTAELFRRSLVTQQELDQAESQLQQAQAQLEIQTAAVDNAQIDLARCTIYSPINGIVIDRQTDVGKTVAASLNAPTLFTIVDSLGKMQIRAAVSEADIGSVALAQEVMFQVDAFPGRQFRGTVSQIRNFPTTQSNVVTYATIIEVDNSDLRLKPGMTANVSIITARRSDVLKVANSALRVRIPESLLPASSPAPAPTAGTGNTPGQRGGTGEVAANRGDAPDGGGRGGGRRGGGNSSSDNQVLKRTLYKSVGTSTSPRVEPVSVRLGISDGVSTEIIDGLKENDLLITYVSLPGTTPVATQPGSANNPFQGGGNRGLGGGGGGGGGGGRGGG
jgi:HlyD family secretion protein